MSSDAQITTYNTFESLLIFLVQCTLIAFFANPNFYKRHITSEMIISTYFLARKNSNVQALQQFFRQELFYDKILKF